MENAFQGECSSEIDDTLSPIIQSTPAKRGQVKQVLDDEDLFISPIRPATRQRLFGSPDLFDHCPSSASCSDLPATVEKRNVLRPTSIHNRRSPDLFSGDVEDQSAELGTPSSSLDQTLPPPTPNRLTLAIHGDPLTLISPILMVDGQHYNSPFMPTPPPRQILENSTSKRIKVDSRDNAQTCRLKDLKKPQQCGDGSEASSSYSQSLSKTFKPIELSDNQRTELMKKRGLRDGQVVRKRDDRKLMHGTDCRCCSGYYNALELSPATRKKRLDKISRHRYIDKPLPPTPEHYWEVDFPSTQELERRGLIRVCTGAEIKNKASKNLFK